MQPIALIPPLVEEHNVSMKVYAREFLRHYKSQKLPDLPMIADIVLPKTKQTAIPADFPVKLRTRITPSLYNKYIAYPAKLEGYSKHLVHIIDHSYAHCLYSLPKTRSVVTCHDLTLFEFEKALIRNDRDRDRLDLFRYSVDAMKKASAIIADSKATQAAIEKYVGISRNKITVVPLGVSEVYCKNPDLPEIATLKKKYWLDNTIVLLHVGSNAFYKNISFLLKTVYVLIKKHKLPIRFIKAGADFTPMQKMLIRTLGLSSSILHLGEVSQKQLLALYNLADVYIAPSLNEGFGLPMLEAMACGTVVVASDRGAIPSVVGHAGILLPLKDHEHWAQVIMELVKNDTQRQELSRKGIERAKQFSWNNTVNKTFEVYQDVLRN